MPFSAFIAPGTSRAPATPPVNISWLESDVATSRHLPSPSDTRIRLGPRRSRASSATPRARSPLCRSVARRAARRAVRACVCEHSRPPEIGRERRALASSPMHRQQQRDRERLSRCTRGGEEEGEEWFCWFKVAAPGTGWGCETEGAPRFKVTRAVCCDYRIGYGVGW